MKLRTSVRLKKWKVHLMDLNVTISCSTCNFSITQKVELPFDCDSIICPKCSNENCLSITKVHEESSMFNRKDIYKRLERIRNLNIT